MIYQRMLAPGLVRRIQAGLSDKLQRVPRAMPGAHQDRRLRPHILLRLHLNVGQEGELVPLLQTQL